MADKKIFLVLTAAALFLLSGCAAMKQSTMTVDPGSVPAGTKVTRQGEEIDLLGNPIVTGKKLPPTELVDAMTMEEIDLSQKQGKVLFLSIVPSIDTKVCEAQTHLLGEEGDRMSPEVERITISRDTPFAQQRFAEEAKLTDIKYLSDYKVGAFGRAMGLLMDGPMLLARSVILVDRHGTVRYIQIVPEITSLPDMEKAFDEAERLVRE